MKILGLGLPELITLAPFIAVLVAYFMVISRLISAAKMKGHFTDRGTGALWFIGIFASPIALGLYTASLPDLKAQIVAPTPSNPREELPMV